MKKENWWNKKRGYEYDQHSIKEQTLIIIFGITVALIGCLGYYINT